MNKILNFFKRNALLIGSISFILLCIAVIFTRSFVYIPTYSEKINNINYDSLSSNPELKTPKVFDLEKNNKKLKNENIKKDLNISFKFKLAEPQRPYTNLFQTADYNEGIRLEFSQDTGAIIMQRDDNDTLLAIPFNIKDKNEYHTIKIIKKINKPFKITFDDELLSDSVHENLWDINKIIVGEGFDNTRTFDGEIKDFHLKYRVYKYSPLANKLLLFIKFSLASLIILCILTVIFENRKTIIDYMKKNINKITFLSFILLVLLVVFGDLLEYIPIYANNISNINYDSLSSDPQLNTPKHFSFKDLNHSNLQKEIEITFDLQLYDLKRDYSDVFQTANNNDGIRLEFSRINAGLAVKEKEDNTFKSTQVPFTNGKDIKKRLSLPIKNTTCKIKIVKKIDTPFKILINNLKKETLSNNNFWQVNNIIVGQGFNETRPFDGKISNFTLHYSVFKHYPIVCTIINVIKNILAFIVILGLIYILINIGMNKKTEKFNIKYFIPGALFTLYYPTFLYLRNMFEMNFSEYLLISLLLLAVWTVLYFLFSRIFSQKDTFFILCCAICYFFICGILTSFIETHTYLHFEYAKQLCACIFIILGLLCYDKPEKLFKTASFAIYILFTLLIITSINNIYTFVAKNITIKETAPKSQVNQNTLVSSKDLPDFYFIILDAYPNGEKLKKYLNFSNEKFLQNLESKGFYVARKSHSNYWCTFQSLPSMLNFSYLDDLKIETPDPLQYLNNMEDKYENNALTELLHKYNYKIFMINSNNMISSKMTYTDVIYNSKTAKSLSLKLILLKSSAIPSIINTDSVARDKILKGFKDLNNAVSQEPKSPKFVFAHILSPHFPFVFDAKGNPPKKNPNKPDDGMLDKALFIGQILYINSQIEPIVDKILAKDKKAIILIFSDHSLELEPSSFDSSFDFRMGNLEAIYTYDKDYSGFYDSMTPVTIIRKILNKYYNMHLPIKEDKIYATYPRTFYYKPIDITERMEQMRK